MSQGWGIDLVSASSKEIKFIVFEGLDGSGKTTQALLLNHWLISRGYDVLLTEEPTRELITGHFVKIALRSKDYFPSVVYLLLFLIDRAVHIEHQIKPALERGKVVISDRYHFSTLAYQTAQGIPREKIEKIVEAAGFDILLPDLTIYIDIPAELAIERISNREKSIVELYERKSFLERVRENYLKLAEEYDFFVVDGTEDPIKIHRKIVKRIRRYFPALR